MAGEPDPLPVYCQPVEEWDASWTAFEREVLTRTNQRRAQGADCGVEGTFSAAGAFRANDLLRCAARNQSRDMAVRNFVGHTNPDGESAAERIDKAGYVWSEAGENIAGGQTTPAEVVDGWMGSPGHCANIMHSSFTELGVGYYFDMDATYGHYWTQAFGRPR